MSNEATSRHRWNFFRAGGFDQVRIESGADLMCLDQLDQKLWLALACPTHGLEFDAKTLELIDTDKDGRIRAPRSSPPPSGPARCCGIPTICSSPPPFCRWRPSVRPRPTENNSWLPAANPH